MSYVEPLRLEKPEEITRLCHARNLPPAILAVFIQRVVLGKIPHITRQDNGNNLPHRGLSCATVPARFPVPPARRIFVADVAAPGIDLYGESWGGRQPVSLMSWTILSRCLPSPLFANLDRRYSRWAPYARNGRSVSACLKRSDFRRRV